MDEDLKEHFITCASSYTNKLPVIKSCWDEIETAYSSQLRFYHNLVHLENMAKQLQAVKHELDNRDALFFALCYHDIVYRPGSQENEQKSAELAKFRLSQLKVAEATIQRCIHHILATASHHKTADPDSNYFTDADLSVFGTNAAAYKQYCQDIRREYIAFPDIVYRQGRRDMIHQFLRMDCIFKTSYFFDQYEEKARKNLQEELELYDEGMM